MKKLSLVLSLVLLVSLLPIRSIVYAADEPVRIGAQLYDTLEEAVTAANNDPDATTIEIIGDVTVSANLPVTSEITIIGSRDGLTVNMANRYFSVISNGNLTLGSGINTSILTISGTSTVLNATNGTVNIKDGIKIQSNSSTDAVKFLGSSVVANISGGEIDSTSNAIFMDSAARINSISGGIFRGGNTAFYISGVNTIINEISGGQFYQTNPNASLNGHTIFIQNKAKIGEISGGLFIAGKNSALAIIRGGQIDKISGGDFKGSPSSSSGTAALNIIGISGTTYGSSRVGEITGGHFYGGYYGVLLNSVDSTLTQIDNISGGEFESIIAFHNNANCYTGEISGGTFIGSFTGINNYGRISGISGDAKITGTGSDGIYNSSTGIIDEISGATIRSNSAGQSGIFNNGTIDLISGGIVIGEQNAINNSNGRLNKITGGVYWGKSGESIFLANNLLLEPDLESGMGIGRYWGKDGVIFNNENLVTYPINTQSNISYTMSTRAIPVNGISETDFRYLRLPAWDIIFDANIPDNADGSKVTLPSNQINIELGNDSYELGSPEGVPIKSGFEYVFTGWNTKADGSGIGYSETDIVSAQISETTITLYAQWEVFPPQAGDNNENGNENENDKDTNVDKTGDDRINSNPKSGDYSDTLDLSLVMLLTILIILSVLLYKINHHSQRNLD